MGFEQASAYCRTCERTTLVGRKTPSNGLHLMIAVFTCALWVIPWFFISLTSGPWRCQTCGGRTLEKLPRSIVTYALGVLAVFIGVLAVTYYASTYTARTQQADPRKAIPVKRG